MIKNNLIDLYREYIRSADMCEAYNKEHRTEIKPRDCVQLKSATGEWVGYFSLNEPNFAELLDHKVRFAVAILDGKPVFPGDIVYSHEGIEHRVGECHLTIMEGKNKGWNLSFVDITNKWSWEPPKKPRTFTLNGVELPCPLKPVDLVNSVFCDYQLLGRRFFFKNEEERKKCLEAFCCLLEEARDKE